MPYASFDNTSQLIKKEKEKKDSHYQAEERQKKRKESFLEKILKAHFKRIGQRRRKEAFPAIGRCQKLFFLVLLY